MSPSAEFAFIDWLRAEMATRGSPLILGPGDDTAILAGGSREQLYAADMLLDGVHFRLEEVGGERAGRKALAVNLSDIAAMAGTPEAATVSLALPRASGVATGKAVMRGILALADSYGVSIAGGDTNSWDGPLVIAISITGRAPAQGAVRRSGAKVGDWICVTGTLGGSLAAKHIDFTPRLAEARLLHERYRLNAMLDLSDGLGSDLRHILVASGVAARLNREAIPISPAAYHAAEAASVRHRGDDQQAHDGDSNTITNDRAYQPRSPLQRALSDGEDFELCFTLPAAAGRLLLAEQPLAPALLISHVGVIEAGPPHLHWEDGSEVLERGWSHDLR